MILNITITKTSRGDQDYIQIMSDDLLSVNIVLVADKIFVSDHRPDVGHRGSVVQRQSPRKFEQSEKGTSREGQRGKAGAKK